MEFNPGDDTGVVDEIDDICGTNAVTYPLASKARRVNFALNQFYSVALPYDKHWTFDDPGQTNLPIGTTDLISGQQDYPFASEMLVAKGVFVKDNQGIFQELTEQEEPQETFTLQSPASGVPTKFKIVGNSILLDKIPNYNMDKGLKITFGRTALKFAATDENKELGVPILFQEWICQVASLPYLIKNKLPNKNDIAVLIAQKKNPAMLDSIPYFMANRNQTKKPGLRIKQESNR